jgi:hypothetical protein
MTPASPDDDASLWTTFHAQTLPESAWTHREHLRIAYLYMGRHPLDEAHILRRVAIIRLNAAQGLVETPTRERLLSTEARARFVEPDLLPLPQI